MRRGARTLFWLVLAMFALGANAAQAVFTVDHSAAPPAYTAGQNVTVTTIMIYDEALTALGFRSTLPAGWTFVSSTDTAAGRPTPGQSGTINWFWITPPASPQTVTYTVAVPAEDTGDKQIVAEAEYRVGAGAIIVPALPDPLVITQLAPNIAVSPSVGTFPQVPVFAVFELGFSISNTGPAALDVTDIFVTDPVNFAVDTSAGANPCGDPPWTLSPASSCTILGVFQPQTAGTFTAELQISSNDPDESLAVVPLAGEGILTPATPEVTPPSPIGFGDVLVGDTSAPREVTITNAGFPSAVDLVITDISLSDPTNFALDLTGGASPCGSTTPAPLGPGESCTVTVVFGPLAEGNITATLTFSTDAGIDAAGLEGTGIPVTPPEIDVTPLSRDFGTVFIGSTGATQVVTIANLGNTDLLVSDIVSSNPQDFLLDLSAGATPCGVTNPTLGRNQNCTVGVTFAPLSEATFAETLTITSNDSDEGTVGVTLAGVGAAVPVPDIAVAPTSLAFGTVEVGDVSAAQIVTIDNTGDADLVVSGITVPDANYAVAPGGAEPCASLTPTLISFSRCTVEVTFEPDALGALNRNLTIASNDPDTPSVTVALTGTGVPVPVPDIDVAPTSLPFGTVTVGTTAPAQTVGIANAGDADLVVSAMTLSNTKDYAVAPGGPGPCASLTPTLPPMAVCTVSVTFTPTEVATLNATLAIASNDPDEASVSVALVGTGSAVPVPNITVAPTSHDFGAVDEGTTSAPVTITIGNAGTADLAVSDFTLSDATNFAVDTAGGANPCGAPPLVLAPAESCTVVATVTPTVPSTTQISADLDIGSDDPDTPVATVRLSAGESPRSGGGNNDGKLRCFIDTLLH